MAQRVSGFGRVPADLYQSPEWTIDDLLSVAQISGPVLEPACGEGQICRALQRHGISTIGSDLNDYGSIYQQHQGDFLTEHPFWPGPWKDIVTNPPYGVQGRLATAFVERALSLIGMTKGQVWMLLPVDFDSAITRRHLFDDCPYWDTKIVLLNRIKWFEDPDVKSTPSANHAWFGWNLRWSGGPRIAYAGMTKEERQIMRGRI